MEVQISGIKSRFYAHVATKTVRRCRQFLNVARPWVPFKIVEDISHLMKSHVIMYSIILQWGLAITNLVK